MRCIVSEFLPKLTVMTALAACSTWGFRTTENILSVNEELTCRYFLPNKTMDILTERLAE
jgi:hypothetical protein